MPIKGYNQSEMIGNLTENKVNIRLAAGDTHHLEKY